MSFEERPIGRRGSAVVWTTMERAGFLVAFTGRTGGGSAPPFDSLNLSQVVGDDDASVHSNRASVVSDLGLAGPFTLPEQVHGAVVAEVAADGAGAGYDAPGRRLAGADAIVTRAAGVPVAVLTADCVPIALASPSAGVLAVVHAGWRGLAAGIPARAMAAFDGAPDVRAAIGPAIGPDHYEVGEDVARQVDAASPGGARTERRDGRLFLDLAGTTETTLRRLGAAGVEVFRRCTACERALFFSHRAGGGVTGRQALVAERR